MLQKLLLLIVLIRVMHQDLQSLKVCDFNEHLEKAKNSFETIRNGEDVLKNFEIIRTTCIKLTKAQEDTLAEWIHKTEKKFVLEKIIKKIEVKEQHFVLGSALTEAKRWNNEVLCPPSEDFKSFRISPYEINQLQWKTLMGDNPSYFKDCDDCPVENVSWDEIQNFLSELRKTTGKNYRLPTEAEWEYACRAGTTTPFYTGNDLPTDKANYDGYYPYNSSGFAKKGIYRQETISVDRLDTNAYGLYNMHGNVWEWCEGYYDKDGNEQHPSGSTKGTYHVLKGGSWFSNAANCRCATRKIVKSTNSKPYYGFRVVLD